MQVQYLCLIVFPLFVYAVMDTIIIPRSGGYCADNCFSCKEILGIKMVTIMDVLTFSTGIEVVMVATVMPLTFDDMPPAKDGDASGMISHVYATLVV